MILFTFVLLQSVLPRYCEVSARADFALRHNWRFTDVVASHTAPVLRGFGGVKHGNTGSLSENNYTGYIFEAGLLF
jgi:hypothetical protein